jgi:hypothetical protein
MQSIVEMLDAIMACRSVDADVKTRAGFLKMQITGESPFSEFLSQMFGGRK